MEIEVTEFLAELLKSNTKHQQVQNAPKKQKVEPEIDLLLQEQHGEKQNENQTSLDNWEELVNMKDLE